MKNCRNLKGKTEKKKSICLLAAGITGILLGVAGMLLPYLNGYIELNELRRRYLQDEIADGGGEAPTEEETDKSNKEDSKKGEFSELSQDSEEEDLWLQRKIDWEGLQQVNADIIGWLFIPGTQVDNPILQHSEDDSFYLYHTFAREESALGSLYIYKAFSSSFSDARTIVFGHNMRSGQMFGDLSNYTSFSFLERYPYVYLYLPDRSERYLIYSAYSCPVTDLTFQAEFPAGAGETEAFVKHSAALSLWEAAQLPAGTEKILTLSTCTQESDPQKRFVINCFAQTEDSQSV